MPALSNDSNEPSTWIFDEGLTLGPFDSRFVRALVWGGALGAKAEFARGQQGPRRSVSSLGVPSKSSPKSPNDGLDACSLRTITLVACGVITVSTVAFYAFGIGQDLIYPSSRPTQPSYSASKNPVPASTPTVKSESSGYGSSYKHSFTPASSGYKPSEPVLPSWSELTGETDRPSVSGGPSVSSSSSSSDFPSSFGSPERDSSRSLKKTDSMEYRDSKGRVFRVSNSDYYRLVAMRTALDAKLDTLDAAKNELDEHQSETERISDTITRGQRLLDNASRLAVNAFNLKVDAFNRRIADEKKMVSRYNLRVTEVNRDVDGFNAELVRVGTPISSF